MEFLLKNKFARTGLFFVFFLLPAISVYGAQSSSTNFAVDNSFFGSGKEMDSTNFSVTGVLSQSANVSYATNALPLALGNITSCGKIIASGTYTLTTNLSAISGSCFVVLANNVTINGGGYTVTAVSGNTNYAVMATSSVANGGSGYSTTTIQNITFSGFGGGINASGNNNSGGAGGNGGGVAVVNSNLGSIVSSGGSGNTSGNGGVGGNVSITNGTAGGVTTSGLTNGSVTISGTNLDLSNKTYTTDILNLSYSGTLTTTNTTLSALTHLIINSNDLGPYNIGGAFPLIPGNINSCGTIYFAGTYTLSGNSTSDCDIKHSGVVLAGASGGAQKILTGNITANSFGVTLSNITVTGDVSTTGAGAGALTLNDSSNLTGTINVMGIINHTSGSIGSLGNTTINTGASVATSSVSFVGDVLNNGTINALNAVAGKTTNNATINGDFIFNASSTNIGTVNGNAILNASSTNTGTITGNATFNMYTAVNNAVSFGGTTAFAGIGNVGGNIFASSSLAINTWIFNASSTNTGIIKGDAIFNDSSSNTVTGQVLKQADLTHGNATFNNNSTNLGTIAGNAYVNSPVVRPIGNRAGIAGTVTYYGYPGLYFNNAVDTSWGTLGNWWLDQAFTIHAPVLPTAGDDVIIYGNITSGGPATVKTAIFEGTSTNGITLTVLSTATDAALFNASSTNGVSGIIIGNATFFGPDTDNLGSVYGGYITRQYGSPITIVGTILHNVTYLTVQALSGAVVNLSAATYDLAHYFFQAFNNASFIWNNISGAGAPNLVINSTVTENNAKWSPNISWGTNYLVQYKTDEVGGGVYVSASSTLNGSDIPRPTSSTSTPHTYYFKSTDSHGDVMEKSVIFFYNNTLPVSTDCSQPLDEATRQYYYLTSNVGNCTITASTTLRGDDGLGHFYTAGNITGSSTNISLANITATGTVSNFNNITVASSTLSGALTINGIFNSDTLSRFGNTTVGTGGNVKGGTFVGTLTNNGTITNSKTTPVTVALSTTNNGTITGGFIFNATSSSAGTTYGTTTWNGASINNGTVNGNTTLNGSAINLGTINGDLTFGTLLSSNNAVTFTGSTTFSGTNIVTGNVKDYQGNIITRWIFNDSSSNIGVTKGNSFFNNSAINYGTSTGDAYFSDSSLNAGTVTGNANVYYSVYSPLSGTVNGTITYHSYPNAPSFRNISGDNDWNNSSNWTTDTTFAIQLGRTPTTNENIVLFASTTLPGDLTNNIFFAVSSSTLDGANHTVHGNISGNGAYGGHNAYSFNLQNITVTGTTTANGGDGTISVNGGKGGIINIATSSTWIISVNGGDPQQDGGDAGEATVINSFAYQDNTPIVAVGGASVGCGYGGNGGNITLIDSSGYNLITDTGSDATTTEAQGGHCTNPPIPPIHRSTGQVTQVGVYHAPSVKQNPVPPVRSGSPAVNTTYNPIAQALQLVVNQLSQLKLKILPVFGGVQKNSFSFEQGILNFLFPPVSRELVNTFKSSPDLLSSFGLKTMQDIYALKTKPILVANDKNIPGIFHISVPGLPVRLPNDNFKTSLQIPVNSYIVYNSNISIAQLVKVNPKQTLTITLVPTSGATATASFNGKKIIFTNNRAIITVPSTPGRYTLSTNISPLPLTIQVLAPNAPATSTEKPNPNIIQKSLNWFLNLF